MNTLPGVGEGMSLSNECAFAECTEAYFDVVKQQYCQVTSLIEAAWNVAGVDDYKLAVDVLSKGVFETSSQVQDLNMFRAHVFLNTLASIGAGPMKLVSDDFSARLQLLMHVQARALIVHLEYTRTFEAKAWAVATTSAASSLCSSELASALAQAQTSSQKVETTFRIADGLSIKHICERAAEIYNVPGKNPCVIALESERACVLVGQRAVRCSGWIFLVSVQA